MPRCDFQHTGIGPLGLSEIERAEYDHIVVAQSTCPDLNTFVLAFVEKNISQRSVSIRAIEQCSKDHGWL